MKYVICIIFLLLSIHILEAKPSKIPSVKTDTLLEKGTKEAQKGNYILALKYWEKATNYPSNSDPRIGIKYIELVTRHRLKEFYKQASRMYSWGFSGDCPAQFRPTIEDEIKRLKPLISGGEFDNWEQNMNRNLTKACKQIISFWKSLDPTFDTPYNERLIEHWERIAFAQTHFKKNTNSIYRADDRANIYVKLGKPDYSRNGTITFNKSIARSWLQDARDFQKVNFTSRTSDSVDTGSNFWEQETQIDKIADRAEILHRYLTYDIWKYTKTSKKLIYIFGQDGNTGEFRILNSLEEMIPDKAFQKVRATDTELTPGFLLQLMFYQQISLIDNYFEDAFSRLEKTLMIRNGIHSLSGFSNKTQNQSNLIHIQRQAPNEKSDYLDELPKIKFDVHQYWLINESQEQYWATYLVSYPQKAIFFDQAKRNVLGMEKDYKVFNSVKILDRERNEVLSSRKLSPIYVQQTGKVSNMEPSSAYFELPVSTNYTQLFSVEVHNSINDSLVQKDSVFPNNIKALLTKKISEKSRVKINTKDLLMGDLMIGIESDKPSKGPVNFKVVHNNIIPANQDLWLHFEIYNLTDQSPSTSKFLIEYKVEPQKKNIFKRLFGASNEAGLVLNFQATKTDFREDIEIGTSPFKPGKYTLTLKVKEPNSGRSATRSIPFTIDD